MWGKIDLCRDICAMRGENPDEIVLNLDPAGNHSAFPMWQLHWKLAEATLQISKEYRKAVS